MFTLKSVAAFYFSQPIENAMQFGKLRKTAEEIESKECEEKGSKARKNVKYIAKISIKLQGK